MRASASRFPGGLSGLWVAIWKLLEVLTPGELSYIFPSTSVVSMATADPAVTDFLPHPTPSGYP